MTNKACARCGRELKRKGFICAECQGEQDTLNKAMERVQRVKEWLRAKIAQLASLTTQDRRKEPT